MACRRPANLLSELASPRPICEAIPPHPRRGPMKDVERRKELCALASVEKDPKKLLALAQEINRLLQEKEEPLKAQRTPKDEKQ